jgi:DNA-binding MarR family transcriptional regulator
MDENDPISTTISGERPSYGVSDADIERLVGALIDDVRRLLTRTFDRRMARLGLTRAQWRVLTFLFRRDGMTQSALAELLEMERAPLGRLLDRLEDSGWIERRADPSDKRAKLIFKTAKIDPILPNLLEDAHEILGTALSGVSNDTRRLLIDELTRVKRNLKASETKFEEKSELPPQEPGRRYSDL